MCDANEKMNLKAIILTLTIIFLMSNVVSVFAQPQPARGGCLNLSGATVPCKPYLQIVSSEMSMSGGVYTGTITLAGNVPSKSGTYLEWDIAIDADRNPNTRPVCAGSAGCTTAQNNMVFNGIGVDYLVVYNLWNNPCVGGNAPCASVYLGSDSYPLPLQAKVSGNTIQLFWKPSDLYGNAVMGSSFDFVILAAMYSGNGWTFGQILSFDTAPNVGHYEFQAGNVTTVP
jgi:hypothetical protein